MALSAPREHLHILAGDLRQGARVFARQPGLVFAALLAMVLGVSASTTVFSLINAVLIRSLPYGNAERLVYMWAPLPNAPGLRQELQPYYADLAAWRKLSHSFQEITAMERYLALLNDGSPQRIGAARVLGNFFETMEASPHLGRTIDVNDDHPGKPLAVVLSDSLWHSRFGADPAVLGRTIHIDRLPYRVIGVMPKEFSYPHGNDFPGQSQFAWVPRTDIWVPAALTPKQLADRDLETFDAVIGRLRPGVGLSRAQSELSAIQRRLEPIHPEGRSQALLVPFIETAIGPARHLLHLLIGAVCLVLLMACSNLAGLLMARAADRGHEIGVRTALGAQRSRLIRLVLTESLMLAAAGGALAMPVSYATLRVIARLNPGNIPRFEETTLDARVLLFGLSVALGAGLLAGIFPAVSASAVSVADLLRHGGRGIAGVSRRARNTLIVAEIALAVVLLAGAGLLIRSYLMVQSEDKGFAPSTLTVTVIPDQQTPNTDSLRHELMNRIRALPGVQAAGSIDDLPLSTFEDRGFIEVEGHVTRLNQTASVRDTAGEYFKAMQIPLIAGRYLNDSDIPVPTTASPQTVVISKSFADRYLPGRDAIGRRLRVNNSRWSMIVGVVGDVRHSGLEEAPEPTIYLQDGLAYSLAIRTVGPPDAIVPAIRKAVKALDGGFTVEGIQTMHEYVDQAAARRRFQTVALTSFAGVAVFLALVGLYGLLSYAITQRTAEIGVRMTLGASRRVVVGMVVLYGLKLTSAGLAIGVCLALALTRVLTSFLYGVRAFDPVTFIVVPAFLITVAIVACLVPAWKAACIDPVSALRQQ